MAKTSLIPEKWIHRLFEITITIKAIDGVLEFIGGFLFMLVKKETLYTIIATLTQHELDQDPNDAFVNWILNGIIHMPHAAKVFGVVYLMFHGGVKMFMAAALWRDKLWAYPMGIAILAVFMTYQLYHFTHTHNPWLIVLTVFDLLVILLIRHEYWYHHARLQKKNMLTIHSAH